MSKLSLKNSFILLMTAVLLVSGFLVSAGTASADTVYGVTQITAVKTYAIPGGDYASGWSWVLNVTVPTTEPVLNMKFADWTGILGNIPAATNLQFYSAQSSNAYDEAHAISITAANTYSNEMDLIPASDLSPRAGKQIQITIEARIPTGSLGGAYSTQFGIKTALDTTAPVITAPIDQTFEATGTSTTPTLIPATATDNVDSNPVITYNIHSFLVGPTTVTWTATDVSGNSSTATSTVIITDNTAPVISVTPDITAEATSSSGAVVEYTNPTAIDLVDGTDTVTCVPASGSTFALGTTTVNCSSTDSHTNTSTSTFTITVQDTTKPVITLNGANPQVIEVGIAYSELGATVFDNYDTGLSATINAIAVNTAVVGLYSVTYDVSDAHGNAATQVIRTVNVVDKTAPVITEGTTPADITVGATSPAGAVVTYTSPTATDNYDSSVTVFCVPVSGSAFALGTALVTCSASDASGNPAIPTTFNVTVQDKTAPTIALNGSGNTGEPTYVIVDGIYTELGAVATDIVDGTFAATPSGSVDTNTTGTYTITYTATDHAGNIATATRTVIIIEDNQNITISDSDGGSISAAASSFSNPKYKIIAKSGYYISDVKVDGNSVVGKTGFEWIIGDTDASYTFTNVIAPHILSAIFAPIVLTSIEIATPATKLTYTVGDALDISGLVVTGHYTDGTSAPVSIVLADVTGFDKTTVGTQTLTVTFDAKTTTYTVDVVAAPVPAPILTLIATPTSATITRSTLVAETSGIPVSNEAVDTATNGLTPIAVTLANTGTAASANVRISHIGDASGHIQLWAKDSANNWYDINITGWIDATGISVPAPYSATTDVYAISDLAGIYNLTANLVDAVTLSTIITSATGTVTVNEPTPISAPVLGTAGNYAILAKTAVTNTGTTVVTGNIGISPAFASNTSGFSPVLDSTGCFSVSDPLSLVIGNIYAADYNKNGCTTPAILTTAVSDMETAYTNTAGQPHGVGPNLNLGKGTVATKTLASGVYTWGSNVTITGDITLAGTETDVWIFQISGTLGIDTDKQIILAGALSQNIFWQVADAVTLKPGSHLEGNILAQTNIAMQTGATLNGRALAQSAVTLDANTIK